MATQMKLEVILAGNRIATRVFVETTKGVNKQENGKRELFPYPCCLKY